MVLESSMWIHRPLGMMRRQVTCDVSVMVVVRNQDPPRLVVETGHEKRISP